MPDITLLLQSYGPVGAIIAAIFYVLPDIKEHLKASAAASRALTDAMGKIEPRLANIEQDTSATREDMAVVRALLVGARSANAGASAKPAPHQRREE